MSLSRHFYPLEDVYAALRFRCTQSDPVESVFWCQELLWSGCASEAISTLFEAWLWHVGPFRLSWLLSAWTTLATDEITEDAIRLAAYRLGTLTRSQRDHSLWQILVLGSPSGGSSSAPLDRLIRKTPKVMPSSDDNEIYLVRAMFQGKARCAWWMAQHITPTRLWELLDWYVSHIILDRGEEYRVCLTALHGYEALLGYRSEEYDVVMRCVAVLMMCLTPSQRADSMRPMMDSLDARLQEKLADWTAACGRKRARMYSLPSGCLYGETRRGRNHWSQDNLVELHCVERHLVECPFWNETIREYADIDEEGGIRWHSDDAMEAFYDRYFPDDIPDEWTLEEKQKSHGNGVLGTKERVTLWKYASRFLSLPSRLAWGYTSHALSCVKGLSTLEYHPLSIVTTYPSVPPSIDPSWMVPVHKMNWIER